MVGGADFCSAMVRFRMTLRSGFSSRCVFSISDFFFENRGMQKYALLLGGTIFNFLNLLATILKGEAVQRRQIFRRIASFGGCLGWFCFGCLASVRFRPGFA